MRVAVLVCAAGLLAGCGGGKPATLADCLNDAGFLVTGSGAVVEGTTPAGVAFTLRSYRGDGAARRAAARLRPRTTAVVAAAVVDFAGNPGPDATVTRDDLATIRGCLQREYRGSAGTLGAPAAR